MEMDVHVDEYLQGEKHQLGRHVTMLLILLLMIIVVSQSVLRLPNVPSSMSPKD